MLIVFGTNRYFFRSDHVFERLINIRYRTPDTVDWYMVRLTS